MPITRISESTHELLQELAAKRGVSIKSILEAAVEAYRRECFLEESNAAFAALRRNAKAWREEQKERAAWDQTMTDGETD
ncbi:ribbon-helix-helix protein, CopG family [Candidatus Acetothermia bacterium]|nr:ribbon-helix-helix protein, CopG family [Candidatus Acetothermia bacterium]